MASSGNSKIRGSNEGKHPVEFYDARERDSKAKWHYDRAGKQRGASLAKGIHNDYQSELLKRGVKNSSGEQLPLERKTEPYKQQSLRHTRLLNVGHDDPNIKTGVGVQDDAELHGFAFRD